MKGRRYQQKWILAVAAIVLAGGSTLQAKPIIGPGDRVVFLGDSITAAGHFVSYVEAHLRLQVQGDPVEVINLGLPSEGCTGLSEPDHPFPRPNVHERLARALEKTRPDVVVACYGMNDGIYYPFSQDRFKKYQQGMQQPGSAACGPLRSRTSIRRAQSPTSVGAAWNTAKRSRSSVPSWRGARSMSGIGWLPAGI